MKREMIGQFIFVGLVITLLFHGGIGITGVDAIDVHTEDDYVVPAYSTRYFSVHLNEDDAMAGWLRINNGDGIHFFIVDQFGHDEVQSSGTATTAYEIHDYPRSEGEWYYWNFEAPDTDTWYVYFSNALSTAYAGVQDEIDIVIRTDTDAPSLISITQLQGPLTGDVVLDFEVVDDCYAVERVELYVDDVLVDTSVNSALDGRYMFEGRFIWRTYNWVDGNYSVYLRAYDTLGKMSGQLGIVEVEVTNSWFDNPMNILLLGIGVIAIIGLLCILRESRSNR